MFRRFRRTKEAVAKDAATKRARAWVEVEQEIRTAIEFGVPTAAIGEAIAVVLRKHGLESSGDRVVTGARRAAAGLTPEGAGSILTSVTLADPTVRPRPDQPRVLVVEDSPDDLELYATYLAAHGFTVTPLDSGADAFSQAVAGAPDAILLDLVLGRDDGLAIVQALRADSRTASMPIVAITAAVPRYLPEVAMAVGCSAFLMKPCLPDDVAVALRAAIARRPSSDA